MTRFMHALAAVALFAATPATAEMRLSFAWGNIPLCTSGKPNRVGNPEFKLTGVPAGTTSVEFRLTDRDVPGYNHGGGKLKLSQDAKIPFGTFKYKSPCPPDGAHSYEWTATARAGSKVIGTAKARRKYPE